MVTDGISNGAFTLPSGIADQLIYILIEVKAKTVTNNLLFFLGINILKNNKYLNYFRFFHYKITSYKIRDLLQWQ